MDSVQPAAGNPSASGVRQWGDEYQDLTAWAAAVELLDPHGAYESVEIEAKHSGHVDDVGRRAKAGPDLYTQLKWVASAARQVDIEFLTTRRTPRSKSLLEKLLASWRALRTPEGCPLMELATTRVLDPEDPLLVLVDSRTCLLSARGLAPKGREPPRG